MGYPMQGACLCGAVTVTVTKPPLLTLACHCSDCQKLCASAYSLTAMFPADGFAVKGEVERGGLKSEGRSHYFCPSCKGFIYSRIAGVEDRVNVRATLFDDMSWFEPFVELMTKDKLPWAETKASYQFEAFPNSAEELQALFDAYEKAQG